MSVLEEIREYARNIEVEFLSKEALESSITAVDIRRTMVDARVVAAMDDDLLFVLFYMYLQGHEYPFTLGSSYAMNYVNDELVTMYREVCRDVSHVVKGCTNDPTLFSVPVHAGGIRAASTPGPNREVYVAVLDLLLALISERIREDELEHLIYLLEHKVARGSIPRRGYSQILAVHSAPVSHKKLKLARHRMASKKMAEDLKVIRRIVFENFTPPLMCIMHLLPPMKAIAFRYTNSPIYCDFSILQSTYTLSPAVLSFLLDSLVHHRMATAEDVLGLRWVISKLSGGAAPCPGRGDLDRSRFGRIAEHLGLLGYTFDEFAKEVMLDEESS
jgi:hypothetical protein